MDPTVLASSLCGIAQVLFSLSQLSIFRCSREREAAKLENTSLDVNVLRGRNHDPLVANIKFNDSNTIQY